MKIIECPRDAMQGIENFIPTAQKVEYLNTLLKVGFDTLDFGSFVSAKAIPQMQDTAEVLSGLDLTSTKTKLLAIIANTRGAETAASFAQINYLGFPLSLSETFQQRNTNKSIADALTELKQIQSITKAASKKLVVYLSMGFGNPYGETYNTSTVKDFTEKLSAMGVELVALSDTTGVSNPALIKKLFIELIPQFKHIEFGAHLHSTAFTSAGKIQAAIEAGCKRFDGALLGFGGCPMASDELTGNIDTQLLLELTGEVENINQEAYAEALLLARNIFH